MACEYYIVLLTGMCFVIFGVMGQSSIPGPRGPPGTRGYPGQRGYTGASGPPGLRGPPGTPGRLGPPGIRGSPGNRGSTGRTGPYGRIGPSGSPGSAGRPGQDGSTGRPGATGGKGDRGDTGSDGRAGSPGVGIPGARGENGEPGPAGPAGAMGPSGPRGEKGDRCFPGYVVGPAGQAAGYPPSRECCYSRYGGCGGEMRDETIPLLKDNHLDGYPQVMFQAFRGDRITGSLRVSQPIRFSVVDVNIGQAYEADTGIFTAPWGGLYVFTFSLLVSDSCKHDQQLKAIMLVQDHMKTELISRGGFLASRTFHVTLVAEDRVWIEVDAASSCMDLMRNGRYNDFSGHMIVKI